MRKNLIFELKRHGYTQSHVAKVLDLSEMTVSKKMNGHSDFSIKEAAAIVDLLNFEGDVLHLFKNFE